MKFFDKAQQLEREKRFEECVATLDELFRELSLFCLQPFCHLASIYEKEGQYGRAFEILERLYRQNPEDHRISDYLINVSLKHFDQLYKEGNDPAALERAELAVSLLQKCDKCDPLYNKDLAIGIHRKASALYRLHRLAEAENTIEDCIRLDPDEKRYHQSLEKIRTEIQESTKRANEPKKSKRGPNERCWCNSGKKYKNCHGKVAR
jgi:tetratricopeptide (TPR) repeat protein